MQYLPPRITSPKLFGFRNFIIPLSFAFKLEGSRYYLTFAFEDELHIFIIKLMVYAD